MFPDKHLAPRCDAEEQTEKLVIKVHVGVIISIYQVIKGSEVLVELSQVDVHPVFMRPGRPIERLLELVEELEQVISNLFFTD